jgi:large subunit ribosomal protein L15
MEIHEIKPAAGSIKRKHRVGRGHGSGSVKTSGRGGKGQTARSGGAKGPGFEGGQTPWYRRLPKLKGFKNARFKKVFQVVPLQKLNRFEEGALIEPALLYKNRLIRKPDDPVKILGNGELSRTLVVKAHAFSKAAQEKINKKGGKTELIS